MARKAASSLRVDPNIRALRIYPVEATKKDVSHLKTIGIKLTREQAIHLARVLLAMSQEHDVMEVTGYRLAPRKSDHTFKITVTSAS